MAAKNSRYTEHFSLSEKNQLQAAEAVMAQVEWEKTWAKRFIEVEDSEVEVCGEIIKISTNATRRISIADTIRFPFP